MLSAGESWAGWRINQNSEILLRDYIVRKIMLLFVTAFFQTMVCNATLASGDQEKELKEAAQAFMEEYAKELRNHDTKAISSRYDESGAYLLGNGRKQFESFDSIKSHYRENWNGPLSFDWEDLSYDALASDIILVTGKFKWGDSHSTKPIVFSYTGILKYHEGSFRILLEDESASPESLKPFLCQSDWR